MASAANAAPAGNERLTGARSPGPRESAGHPRGLLRQLARPLVVLPRLLVPAVFQAGHLLVDRGIALVLVEGLEELRIPDQALVHDRREGQVPRLPHQGLALGVRL